MSATVWRLAALVVAAAMGAACGDAKSGPNTPLSIEFLPAQLPSLLVGDQLHDTLGNVDSLHAIIFNSSGDTISGAPVRYQHADTTRVVTIDSITGHVTANDTGAARVVAQTTGLQSPPETLFVVSRPDLLAPLTPLDTVLADTTVGTDTLLTLAVGLRAGGNPVNHWRIEYRFIYPADLNTPDSSLVLLVDDNRKFSLVDTTGTGTAAGTTTRSLHILPFAHPFNDSVVVEARAFYPDHTAIPGSPVRFKVLVTIR